jgi:lipid-A-disaccharide synthase
MQILLSSGEASGDLYASELLRELRKREPSLAAFGLGGERSREAGAELLVHLDEISVIGLFEVVSKLPALRRAMSILTEAARVRRPDAAVLVDFSGFNLRLARRLRALGVPVIYYVSPQVWAWRRGRVKTIRKLVDEMLVILPFEEEFYREQGVRARYVGHPLVDLVDVGGASGTREDFCAETGLDPARPVLMILPGSRRREIELHVPVLREVVEALASERPELQFLVSRAPTVAASLFESAWGASLERVSVLEGPVASGLKHARAAVVASGTATVEAALCGTPMVVVYRVGRASYALGRPFVRVPYFSRVNLVAESPLVPELIQDDFSAENVLAYLLPLLDGEDAAKEMRRGLVEVQAKLGGGGASSRAAEAVLARVIMRSNPQEANSR